MSRAQTRTALLHFHDDGFIDDEELALLFDINASANPEYPYWKYDQFDLDRLTDDECSAFFRFQKDDIYRLSEILLIPEKITCYNRTKYDGIEALCVFLKRNAYPSRYVDLIPHFAQPIPKLCMQAHFIQNHIYDNFGHLLSNLDQPWLAPQKLEAFAAAISEKGSPLTNCWGFVDGTVRATCRPSTNQGIIYNGHKRVHAIKFQSVATPNGMIANLYGPVEGKRHDSAMLHMSGLLGELQNRAVNQNGDVLCIYGDPAYPLRPQLQAPFSKNGITDAKKKYNSAMSSVRVSVEWVFKEIINYFKFLDFKKNLKLELSAVGKTYLVCALLTNARTCLYGNQTSAFFRSDPPSLEEYFFTR